MRWHVIHRSGCGVVIMEKSIVFTSAKYQAHEGVNENILGVIDGIWDCPY